MLLRNETCLLSYSIIKQNRPENHNRIPSHPDTPHPSPSLTPIYRPLLLCQLLFCSFLSLLGQLFLLACASHIGPKPITEPLSHSICPLSDLARFRFKFSFSPNSHPEIREREREKKKRRENERKCLRHANLYLAKHLHGSMTP